MPTAILPKPESKVTKTKNKPAAEFRTKNLRVTIWPSIGKDGVTRYNSAITRSYQADGVWRETSYLGAYDLAAAKALIDKAEKWLSNLPQLRQQLTSTANAVVPLGQY